MAAPSVGRRSRQRQSVVSLREKRTAALKCVSKPPQGLYIERTKATCPATVFFLSPLDGAGCCHVLRQKSR